MQTRCSEHTVGPCPLEVNRSWARRPPVLPRPRLLQQLLRHTTVNQTGLRWTSCQQSQHKNFIAKSNSFFNCGRQPSQQLLGSKLATTITTAGIIAAGLFGPLYATAQDLAVNIEPVRLQQQVDQEPAAAVAAAFLASTAPLLPAAEAPALVSNSGDVLLEAARGVVAGTLPDLAANSMTAVGGPVVTEPPAAAPGNIEELSKADTAVTTAHEADKGQASPSAPAVVTASPGVRQDQQQAHNQPPMPAAADQGLICGMWQAYCHALDTSPLKTKIYTGIVGTLIGDLAAQILSARTTEHSSKNVFSNGTAAGLGFRFDAGRCFRLCLFSAAIGTPLGHFEYALLERCVLPAAPTSPAAVAAKVCLDQLVQTPLGMALFFSVMKVLEGQPHLVKQELETKMVSGLLANWKLWPAAQLLNFTLIPPEQRILFGNMVGICWTCIISNMQQRDSRAAAAVASSRSSANPVASSVSNSRSKQAAAAPPAAAAAAVPCKPRKRQCRHCSS